MIYLCSTRELSRELREDSPLAIWPPEPAALPEALPRFSVTAEPAESALPSLAPPSFLIGAGVSSPRLIPLSLVAA